MPFYDRFWLDLEVEFIVVEYGKGIADALATECRGELTGRCREFRRSLARRKGLIIPPIRLEVSDTLPAFAYVIWVMGVGVAEGELISKTGANTYGALLARLRQVCTVYAPRVPTRDQIIAIWKRLEMEKEKYVATK
jgi:hypothetical protein